MLLAELVDLASDVTDAEPVATLPSIVSADRTLRRLHRSLSHLPVAVRHSRIDQFVTLVVGTVAGWEWAPHRGERRLPLEQFVAELLSTSTGLLEAPLTVPRHVAPLVANAKGSASP